MIGLLREAEIRLSQGRATSIHVSSRVGRHYRVRTPRPSLRPWRNCQRDRPATADIKELWPEPRTAPLGASWINPIYRDGVFFDGFRCLCGRNLVLANERR